MQPKFLSVVLSERSESTPIAANNYSMAAGTATKLRLLAPKGVLRLLAALVAQDDKTALSAEVLLLASV